MYAKLSTQNGVWYNKTTKHWPPKLCRHSYFSSAVCQDCVRETGRYAALMSVPSQHSALDNLNH